MLIKLGNIENDIASSKDMYTKSQDYETFLKPIRPD